MTLDSHGGHDHLKSPRTTVSVVCSAYNHEPFIADALDGILSQRTDFPIEVIVHDDASTDRTADIIRQYEAKNPGRLRCLYQSQNQYSKKGLGLWHDYIFPQTSGEFIAICDGDDHWSDPEKLAKQVRFMRDHPTVSMSFHQARIVFLDEPKLCPVFYVGDKPILDPKRVVAGGGSFYPTSSSMFKREVLVDCPPFLAAGPIGDAMWALSALIYGDVGYLGEVMTVYTSGAKGSWSISSLEWDTHRLKKFLLDIDSALRAFDQKTGHKFSSIIHEQTSRNIMSILADASRNRILLDDEPVLRARMKFKHRLELALRKVSFAVIPLLNRSRLGTFWRRLKSPDD